MDNDHKERFDYAETLYEPAIEDKKFFMEDVKPPVVKGHNKSPQQTKGSPSAAAPDGVAGNWK